MGLDSILFGDIGLDESSQAIRRKNTILSSEEVDRLAKLAGEKHNVGKDVVRAVIDIESGDYNPRATNKDSTAKGLMQLIDGTAAEMGVTDAFDPMQNVMGGAKYLRTLLDKYDGDEESAVMAYFKGPVAVDRAKRKGMKPSQIGGDLGGTTASNYWNKFQQNRIKYQGEGESSPSTSQGDFIDDGLGEILFGDTMGSQKTLRPEINVPDLTVNSNQPVEQKPVSLMDELEASLKPQGGDQDAVATQTDPLIQDKYKNIAEQENAFQAGAKTGLNALTYTESPVDQYRFQEHPIASVAGAVVGSVTPALIGGMGVQKSLLAIPKVTKLASAGKWGQVAFQGVTRSTTAGVDFVMRNNEELTSSDEKVREKAVKNLAVSLAASMVSPTPEVFIPKGAIQPIAQMAADAVVNTIGQAAIGSNAWNEENIVNTIASVVTSGLFAFNDIKKTSLPGEVVKPDVLSGDPVKADIPSVETPTDPNIIAKGEPVGRSFGEVDNEAAVRNQYTDDINAKQESQLTELDSELNPPPKKPLSRAERRALVESGMNEDPVVTQMKKKYGEEIPTKKQVAQDFTVSREKASQMIKQVYGGVEESPVKVIEKEPELLPPRWEQKEKVVESGAAKPIQSGLTAEEISGLGKQNELPGSKKESGSGKQGSTGVVGKVPQKPVEPKPDIADADWVKLKEEIHDDSYPTEYEEWFKNLSEKEQEEETYRAWADANPKVYDEVRQQELGLGKTENPEDPVALGKEANRLMRKIRKEVSALSVSGKDKKSIEDYILGRSSELPSPDVMKKYKQSLESGLVTELEVLRLEGNVQGKEYLNSQGEWDYDGVHRMIQDNYKSSATYGRKLGVRKRVDVDENVFVVGETVGGFTPLRHFRLEMAKSEDHSGILRPDAGVEETKATTLKVGSEEISTRIHGPELSEMLRAISDGGDPIILDKLNTKSGQALGMASGKKIWLKGDIFIGPLKAAVISTGRQRDFEIATIKEDLIKSGVKEKDIVVKDGKVTRVFVRDPDFSEQVLSHEMGHVISSIRHLDDEKINLGPSKLLGEGIGPKISGISKGVEGYFGAKGVESIEELKHLTGIWNPFDPKADPKYTKYRHNPEELYADAVSALFVHPDLVKQEAPEFYKGFMKYMENRPELMDSYKSITGRATKEELYQRRKERELADFKRGDDIRKAEMKERLKEPEGSVISDIKNVLLSANEPLLKRRTAAKKDGVKIDPENDPLYFVEELKYISGPAKAMLSDIETKIGSSLEKSGLSNEQMGLYLGNKRQSTELIDKPGSHGIRDKYAIEQLESLKNEIGEEKFKVLEKAANDLWKIRNEYVIPLLKKSGMFADPLLSKIVNNENYSKNTIVDYMEKDFGERTTRFLSGNLIHAIKGTFQGKANPFTETIIQDISLMRATHRNEASKSMVDFLKSRNNDEIVKVDSKIEYSKDSNKDIISFVEVDGVSGKAVVNKFEVPKEVAELLNKETINMGKALKLLYDVTSPIKAAMTTLRPAFIVANGFLRDPFALAKNIPRANLLNAYKNVLGSYPEVWRAVRKGILSDNMKEMYKDKSLIVGRNWRAKDVLSGDDELARMTINYLDKGGDPDKFIKRQVMKVLNFIEDVAETSEKATKMAGYKILKEKSPEIGTRQRAHMVRKLAGSPDFMDGGTGRLWINNAMLFSNANIQGWRASAEAFSNDKAGYALKSILYDFLPKTLMFAAAHGALKAVIGDEQSDWLEDAYAQASDTQKARYHIVPVWKHKDNSYTLLKIPKDFTGQATGAIYWHMLNAGKNATEKKDMADNIASIFSEGFSQSPISISSLHPFLTIPWKAADWLGGKNPVDDWNQKSVIPQNVYGSGKDKELPYMLKYAAGELGLNTIYRAPNKVDLSDKDLWQKIYGVPFAVNPTLSAFFVQTNPNYKPLTDEELAERKTKKVKALDKNEAILEHIKANKSLATGDLSSGSKGDLELRAFYLKLKKENVLTDKRQTYRAFKNNYKEKAVNSGLRIK